MICCCCVLCGADEALEGGRGFVEEFANVPLGFFRGSGQGLAGVAMRTQQFSPASPGLLPCSSNKTPRTCVGFFLVLGRTQQELVRGDFTACDRRGRAGNPNSSTGRLTQ